MQAGLPARLELHCVAAPQRGRHLAGRARLRAEVWLRQAGHLAGRARLRAEVWAGHALEPKWPRVMVIMVMAMRMMMIKWLAEW